METKNTFNNWLKTSSGQQLIADEEIFLDQKCWNKIFGDVLLMLGDYEQERLFKNGNYRNKIILPIPTGRLKIPSNSIHAVLLPHTLDFSKYPFEIIKESERVLISTGYIIIITFNKTSNLYIKKLFYNSSEIQENISYLYPNKIKEWLEELDLKIISHHYAFTNEKCFLSKWIQTIAPFLGEISIIIAKKNIPGMTPIRRSISDISPALTENGFAKPVISKRNM